MIMALTLVSCETSPTPTVATPGGSQAEHEVIVVKQIRQSRNKADMIAYLEAYPQGRYRPEVLGYYEKCLWQNVQASSYDELEGRLQAYLNRFPSGQHAKQAQAQLPEARQLAKIDEHHKQADIIIHLDQFPRSPYRLAILTLLDHILWNEVQGADDAQLASLMQAYRRYFPTHHPHVQATQQRLNIADHLRQIRQDKRVEDMVSYLNANSSGPHREEVLSYLEQTLWKAVETAGAATIEARVNLYHKWFPTGANAEEARQRLKAHHTSHKIDREQQLIATIRQNRREGDMRLYLKTHPTGTYRSEVLQLLESHLWQVAQASHWPELESQLETYLEAFPQGQHTATARARLIHERLISTVQQYKRRRDMISYLEQYPNGLWHDQVTAMLEADLWQAVESAKRPELAQRLAAYEARFPKGPHARDALALRREIGECVAIEAADTYRRYKAYLKIYPQGICATQARIRISHDYWKSQPETAHVYRQIAAIYAAYPDRDVSKAISYYSQAIDRDKNDVGSLVQLGKLYDELNQIEKAKAKFREAIVLDINNYESHKWLGNLYKSQKKQQKAIFHYHKATLGNPYCIICYRYLGTLRWTALDRKQALEDFLKVKKLGEQYLVRKNLSKKEQTIIKNHIRYAEGFLNQSNSSQ